VTTIERISNTPFQHLYKQNANPQIRAAPRLQIRKMIKTTHKKL